GKPRCRVPGLQGRRYVVPDVARIESGTRKAIGMHRNASHTGLVCALALAATLLVAVPAAFATPPSLDSIDLAPGNNHPTLHWSLPHGVDPQGDPVRSEFLQTATSSDTNVDGYFLQKNVITFTTLDP